MNITVAVVIMSPSFCQHMKQENTQNLVPTWNSAPKSMSSHIDTNANVVTKKLLNSKNSFSS